MQGEAGEDVVALGNQVDPARRGGIAEQRGDQPTLRRVEGRRAHQPVTVDVDAEPGRGLDAFDDRRPPIGRAVEQEHVGAAPPLGEVDEEPAAVLRERDLGPRLLVRQVGEARRVGGRGVAQPVPPHGPVVAGLVVADLGRVRVARVGEAGAVGEPRDRRRPGVGQRVGQERAGRNVEHLERRPLVAAGGGAEGHQGPVGRRLVPVDRGRDLARRVGRVDEHATRSVDGLVDRPDDQRGAVPVAPAVDREELVAAHGGRQRGAGGGELGEPVAEPPSRRDGVEGGAGALVLGGGPRPHLGRRAVLQPAVGVGDLDPVEDLGGSVGPGGRRRRDLRQSAVATSCGRGWACGRGWPSSCGPGGWPSSCAST